MNDRYLWGKSGDPDPFVARLEAALGEVRSRVQVIGVRKPHVLRRVGVVSAVVVAAAGLILWLCAGSRSAGRDPADAPPAVASEERRAAPAAAIAVSDGIVGGMGEAPASEPGSGPGASADLGADSTLETRR